MKEGFLEFEDERAYVLKELEVYNWGPFGGRHRAEFDERGTAIIGATGSGKTTLVDSLMTLLADQPRYNLASTGGHDKNDRTLISYVRGVGGSDLVARPGKTVTGVSAKYENDRNQLRAGAIFWTDGPSNSQQDLKRRWFFAEDECQTLGVLLRKWQEEGARGLMKHGRETAGLRIFESKKSYLAHVRKVFDVSENAFNLLNRAAGLKQLDSVDTIFRELVLDDHAAFDRALEVAGDFDTLAGIHQELEEARRQRESLLPIAADHEKLAKSNARLAEERRVKDLAPRWYARLGLGLWERKKVELEGERKAKAAALREMQGEVALAVQREDDLRVRFLELGGRDLEQIEATILAKEELVRVKQRKAEEYQVAMRALGLDERLEVSRFAGNVEVLEAKKPELEKGLHRLEEDEAEARSMARQARQRCERLEEEIRAVKASPGSNLPIEFQRFRRELAVHLKMPVEDLPFVAELVEVKAEEAVWRGAIERALGSNRLRILVPVEEMREALRWVNARDNRLHVRFQEARLDEAERDYFFDSFIHKLNLKGHRLRPALENLLASQDYHCVADTETLRETPHGLTKEGTMSGKGGRFDKQDQRGLSEGWMTGFDNRDRLQALARELLEAQAELGKLDPEAKSFLQKRNQRAGELRMMEGILQLTYEEIDVPGVQGDLKGLRDQLERMRAPDSEMKVAQEAYEEVQRKTKSHRDQEKVLGNEVAVLEDRIGEALRRVEEFAKEQGAPFSGEEETLGLKKFGQLEGVTNGGLDQALRETMSRVEDEIEKWRESGVRLEKRLVSGMSEARNLNPGPYMDAGVDLLDVPVYLAELKRLEVEGLPEKKRRFLEYLNQSSGQGVNQLLAQIDQEVSEIEERIDELNFTLAKVDFREGHFLKLQLKRLSDTTVRELERARRHLRDAELKEDEGQSHYRALQAIVSILREAGNNRHLVGSRALLDARYRLEFRVVEVNRKTGEASSERSGSQSGSGGEKELMSSHILTASLSYALCPSGASRPLYGTIILDEAFSKSSQSAARLIVEALQAFGLYPVFVTPNKEISLLKKHTRRAICVQRTESGSSLATISWEKLAELQPTS